jgi:BRCT domain type II-containing protein
MRLKRGTVSDSDLGGLQRVKHTDSETVPSTARSKKRERPSSKKSTDTEEEYFAIKRAEFDELDNFELASQSPPATPAPSKRHKPKYLWISTLFIFDSLTFRVQ